MARLKNHYTVGYTVINGKISVIIVTYNAANTLQQCLNSVFAQKYTSIEIIVIDGQSIDGTIKILEKNDTKLAYWKSEPDNGIYDAMNKAVKQATGNWIYFLGADDFLFADFSNMAETLSDPDAIYYGSVLTKGLKRYGKVSAYHMAKIGIFHQAIIYPSKVFTQFAYNQQYVINADYALNMQCYNDKSFKWIFKDYVIANFNHTGLSGTERDEVFEANKTKLIRENFGYFIWLRYMIKQFKRRHL